MPDQIAELTNKQNLIFIERVRKDEFLYLVELEEESIEVKVTYQDGELVSVDAPYDGLDLRSEWKLKGSISQIITNVERRLFSEGIPLLVNLTEAQSMGDGPAQEEKKESKPKKRGSTVPINEGLSLEKVVIARRHFRDPRHRDLVITAEAERLEVNSWTLSCALRGTTWKSANEEEAPLTQAEINAAIAHPVKYTK